MNPTVNITNEVLQRLDLEYQRLAFKPVQDVSMDRGRLILTEEGGTRSELLIGADAQHYLAEYVKVPTALLSGIDDPQLSAAIWNYFIGKRGSDVSALKAVVDTPSGEIKKFTTRSFAQLSPSQIVQACQGSIPDCVFEREPSIHRGKVEFYLTGPDLYENFQTMMAQGLECQDVHHFSIGVSYDFEGGDSPGMRGYGHRHNCGNLMDAPYGVTGKNFRIYSSEPAATLAKFGECTRLGIEFIRNKMIPRIRATMDAKLQEPLQDLLDLVKEHKMPPIVEELLFESYRTEDLGGTKYHIVNAVTRAANSDRCPDKWRSKLRELAGLETVQHDPATFHDRRCSACHQQVKLGGTEKKKAK